MNSCRLCDSHDVVEIGTQLILGRHSAKYYECRRCTHRQTETPWWLEEAYAEGINRFDTGSLARTLCFALIAKAVVAGGYNRHGRFLDFGGGHGLFVRRMRDLGLDFRWQDRYCPNLYALGFEADPHELSYELVTCFEVFEHMVEPRKTVESLLEKSGTILFSTELAPETTGQFFDWPYLGLEHGQHVSFFTDTALRRFADSQGLNFVTDGIGLHMLSRRPYSARGFHLLTRMKIARAVSFMARWPSLTYSDHEAMRKAFAHEHGRIKP